MMSVQPQSITPANLRPPRYLRAGGGYSRFVATMKLLLPAIALGLVLLVVVWPRLQEGFDRIRVTLPRLDLSEARDLRMVNAHYSGIDKNHRPYTVTADVARQTPNRNDLISLEGPKADITLTSGAWLALTGDTGVYLTQGQLLDLFGDVKLYHDRGYELDTDTAHIDMAAGNAEGHDRVTGQGVFGNIVSEGFRILDHGNTIIFTGKAKLHLTPRPVAAPLAQAAGAQPSTAPKEAAVPQPAVAQPGGERR